LVGAISSLDFQVFCSHLIRLPGKLIMCFRPICSFRNVSSNGLSYFLVFYLLNNVEPGIMWAVILNGYDPGLLSHFTLSVECQVEKQAQT